MVHESYYDVLFVNKDATFEEIKQAFKRRALQVHPDKGGSKEAFHVVYQALEILSDPGARKSYDLKLKSGGSHPTGKRKAEAATPPGARPHPKSEDKSTATRKRMESKPMLLRELQKILSQIHELLKEFDREVRQEIILKEFSQQQRLFLEQWMVDHTDKQRTEGAAAPSDVTQVQEPQEDDMTASSKLVCKPRSMGSQKVRPRPKKKRSKKQHHLKGISATSKPGKYIASVSFHGLEIQSGKLDLPTALEYLVILTAVKQKMLAYDPTRCDFAEHLEEALICSAREQGRIRQDLSISFSVQQRAAMFIGHRNKVRTPRVKNIRQVVRVHKLLAPFRSKVRGRGGTDNNFFHYSIADMEMEWKQFQQAVADAWEAACVDSTEYMLRLSALYRASSASRARHLQIWERHQMSTEDASKHRPRVHRPISKLSPEEKRRTKMRELLTRWTKLLRKLLDKKQQEHYRVLLRQRKKRQEETRRLQFLEQKRLQKAECLRREALRQRMKADLTMDEIFGRSASN